mmetsp:Transcript_25682/g.74096  ORF Transcript_25682/g.74096 Transcript_25682/m.74096 type:complete len:123 (-) Transcript_25682:51-419(-)
MRTSKREMRRAPHSNKVNKMPERGVMSGRRVRLQRPRRDDGRVTCVGHCGVGAVCLNLPDFCYLPAPMDRVSLLHGCMSRKSASMADFFVSNLCCNGRCASQKSERHAGFETLDVDGSLVGT